MLRTALRPKWLSVLVLALAIASVCAWAGSWQWRRAHEQAPQAAQITNQPARELTSVLAPQQPLAGAALATPVLLHGTLDRTRTLVVQPKSLNGQTGRWLVAAVDVPQPDGGPARLPIVLGWTADPQLTVADLGVELSSTVEGVLQQPDPPATGIVNGVSPVLSTAELAGEWGAPMYTAYLIPVNGVSVQGVSRIPVPDAPGEGLAWQNLSYALQWFVFAGFAVFIWWRMVRDDYRDQLEEYRVRGELG